MPPTEGGGMEISMNTAVVSVKGCVCFIGVLAICIVFAILFLQERECVYAFLGKWKIFKQTILQHSVESWNTFITICAANRRRRNGD